MADYIKYSSGDDTTPSDEESVVESAVISTSASVYSEVASFHEEYTDGSLRKNHLTLSFLTKYLSWMTRLNTHKLA